MTHHHRSAARSKVDSLHPDLGAQSDLHGGVSRWCIAGEIGGPRTPSVRRNSTTTEGWHRPTRGWGSAPHAGLTVKSREILPLTAATDFSMAKWRDRGNLQNFCTEVGVDLGRAAADRGLSRLELYAQKISIKSYRAIAR